MGRGRGALRRVEGGVVYVKCVWDMLSFSTAVNWIYGHRLAQTKLLIDHIPYT